MSCNVTFNSDGSVKSVVTDAGTPSQLWNEAKSKFPEKEALDIFYVSQSDEFKDTLPPQEKLSPQRIAEKYTRLINKIKKEQPEDYWSVDVPSQTEIIKASEEGRIVDVKGGMGIVTEDGNMIGLFKYDPSKTGTAAAVQEARVKMGGIKLDNFDGYLTKTYQRNGFRVAARIPFNEEYAPEGWNKEKHGTPDVVFMIYDPNGKLNLKERTFTDYEDAQSYRDSFVEEAKIGHPFYGVNPLTSSNYANLTEDGEGNFVFYHRGGKGYETIKRSTGSTLATSKTEGSALAKVGGVAMYYTAPEDSESVVTGATKYAVKIPVEKVYDFNSDPLNLIKEAKAQHAQEHPDKAFDANTQVAYITKLAGERGYDMVVSEWAGKTRAQTIKELTPVDTQETDGNIIVKPFKNDYVSNRQKGYISVIPKSKEDSFQDIYNDIYKERNAVYKYDNLYRLPETSIKLSQEEITDMIMNSDISQELKDRYQTVLYAPVQRRESFKVQEPTLEDVMKYITSQNESKEPMNDEQKQDFKNVQISTEGFTYENLKAAFYDENGIFFVSIPKLVKSGLYSQYEAEHLQKDIELQKRVKESIDALKNTDEVTPIEQDFDTTEKENEFNSFGKLNNLNPYIVQKQIQNTLAATTREEFDELIGELPFSNFQKSVQSEAAKDELFNKMQAYKKAEMMIDVGGTLKPSLNANTEVVVPQVAQDLTGTKVLSDIKYFMGQDLTILKRLDTETRTLLNSIEKGLINKGYDVIGLSSKAPDVYMMQYFDAVVSLSEGTSKESLEEYVAIYNEYFTQDLSPEKGFIKTEQNDRNFVKLNTELSEEEVYNQQGLIKQEEGIYIRVNKKTSDELYPIIMTYPEKLPEGIKTEEELRKYVQSQINNDEVSNAETAEVINLFKMYYDISLQEKGKKVNVEEFNQKQAQFTGNQDYLMKDFVSDFYAKGLQEKDKESKEYRDFYRHFKVTEKGLELVNNDPITLETIQPYVTEDLANYSLLSKSMPNLKTEEVDFVDSRNSRRNMVVNYPSTVAKFDGNISILDDNNLVAKNTSEEFIRLKNDVYENTQTIGNLTMYKRLDTPKSDFLNFAVEKPEANFLLEEYTYLENKPESFIKSKNYLSKEERDGLAEDEFGCL